MFYSLTLPQKRHGPGTPHVQAKCTERNGSLKEPFFREMKGPFIQPVHAATTCCADMLRKLQRAKEFKTKELKIYGREKLIFSCYREGIKA
jgi:hypothetical protein